MRASTVLNAYLDWPHVGQVFRVERHVTDLLGENPRDEVAFGIADLGPDEMDAAGLNALVRSHWGIETRCTICAIGPMMKTDHKSARSKDPR